MILVLSWRLAVLNVPSTAFDHETKATRGGEYFHWDSHINVFLNSTSLEHWTWLVAVTMSRLLFDLQPNLSDVSTSSSTDDVSLVGELISCLSVRWKWCQIQEPSLLCKFRDIFYFMYIHINDVKPSCSYIFFFILCKKNVFALTSAAFCTKSDLVCDFTVRFILEMQFGLTISL